MWSWPWLTQPLSEIVRRDHRPEPPSTTAKRHHTTAAGRILVLLSPSLPPALRDISVVTVGAASRASEGGMALCTSQACLLGDGEVARDRRGTLRAALQWHGMR